MNIPLERLPSYLSESELKAFAEKTRSGPIDAAASLRSTLSQEFHGKASTEQEGKRAARNKPHAPWTIHDGERRQQERRQKHQAVVLDTRLKQRRREAVLYPSVNFEI